MPADMDALNYPYIRVRSADWLKRTLLVFPHVVRMTPGYHAPADDPDIAEFCEMRGRRAPLLRAADLHADHVREAQRELIAELTKRLASDRRAFFRRFGRYAAQRRFTSSIGRNLTVWEQRLAPNATFQIHAYKLLEELADYLREEELAWEPDRDCWDSPGYLEMHPRLGEAVMATLAVACAENEGLQVVTEFPRLHGKLLGTPRDCILAACIDGSRRPGHTSGQQLAEFLVYRRCNADLLSAQSLVALKSEKDALVEFRGKLDELAKSLPPTIYSEPHLEERLNDALNDMFREWEQDQANLSSYSRRLFGDGVLPEAAKLAQKLAEAAMKPETIRDTAGVAGAGGLMGLHTGNLTLGVAAGAGAGFAVALVYRGIEAWRDTRRTARKSPLRYLTQLQDQGVSFTVSASVPVRTDAIA